MAVPSVAAVRKLLLHPLRARVLEAFREDEIETLGQLTASLQNAGTPAASMLVLWLLEQIALANPGSPSLVGILEGFPGRTLVERLEYCRVVMRLCFSPRCLG